MEHWSMMVIAAILVEAVTNALKPIWDASKRKVDCCNIVPLVIGMVIAFAANLDIMGTAGIAIGWPVLPQLITGIIISRGANYVYDIVHKISTAEKNDTGTQPGEDIVTDPTRKSAA